MYFGNLIFFEQSFNLVQTPFRNADGSPTDRLTLNTICFHTFILMNLFNQINCRVVNPNELNVFKTLFNNGYFWLIFIFEILLQHLFIKAANSNLGSALLGTAPLTQEMQLTCWLLGATSLLVNLVLKKIPLANFKFTEGIDLENDNKNEFINRYTQKMDTTIKQGTSLVNEGEEES